MDSISIKWTTSKARDSYGYNLVTLRENGRVKARTCGGGYDMAGTVLGEYIARKFSAELLKLEIPMNQRNGQDVREYYGLTYHDPNYDPGKAEVEGGTIEEREKAGKSVGLERYQAFYSASSNTPTKRHTTPLIDGACGFSSVEKIINGLGYTISRVHNTKNEDVYTIEQEAVAAV